MSAMSRKLPHRPFVAGRSASGRMPGDQGRPLPAERPARRARPTPDRHTVLAEDQPSRGVHVGPMDGHRLAAITTTTIANRYPRVVGRNSHKGSHGAGPTSTAVAV